MINAVDDAINEEFANPGQDKGLLKYSSGSRNLDKRLREKYKKEIRTVKLDRTPEEWQSLIALAKRNQDYHWDSLSKIPPDSVAYYLGVLSEVY